MGYKFSKSTVYFTIVVIFSWTSGSANNPETSPPLSSYDVVMSWNEIDYDFSSSSIRQEMIDSKAFIPKNNIPHSIKVVGERIFVTIPRNKAGIPVTLAYVTYDPSKITPTNPVERVTNSPLLVPYPSWDDQLADDCNAFQNAQSIEVDQYNRIWIVDSGSSTGKSTGCYPKLVIIDLDTDERLLSYNFPKKVFLPNNSPFGNIVVSCSSSSTECWSYISNSISLVVFNLKNKHSWTVRHSSMTPDPKAMNITILDHNYVIKAGINGLAISPRAKNYDRIYYSSLSSYNLYSISTDTLKNIGSTGYSQELSDEDVKFVGKRYSQADGFSMSSNGLLLYGVISSNAISYWKSSKETLSLSQEILLIQNDIELQWPSSISFDDNGYVYAVTNRMQRDITDTYDPNDVNFRIVRSFFGFKSYQNMGNVSISNTNEYDSGVTCVRLSDPALIVSIIVLISSYSSNLLKM